MVKPRAELVFGDIQVVLSLQSLPELRGIAKEARQPQGGIGGDGAFAKHDLVDAARIHTNVNGEAVLAQVHRLDEFLQQHFTRMDGGEFLGHNYYLINNKLSPN